MPFGPNTNAPAGATLFAADPEGQLTLEDVEPLVLAVVDVERRAGAPRGPMLDDRNAARLSVSAEALIVARTPKDHSASPSPGC